MVNNAICVSTSRLAMGSFAVPELTIPTDHPSVGTGAISARHVEKTRARARPCLEQRINIVNSPNTIEEAWDYRTPQSGHRRADQLSFTPRLDKRSCFESASPRTALDEQRSAKHAQQDGAGCNTPKHLRGSELEKHLES